MKTNDKILHILKREGAMTAKHLAERLNLTTMGVRLQLQGLEAQHWIEHFDVKAPIGRPQKHWQLTQHGHAQFSNGHNDLLIQLFDAIEDKLGNDGLMAILSERECKSLAHYQAHLKDDETVAEKLHHFAKLRDQEGYITEVITDSEGFWFIENHCPICQAATRCQHLCQSEFNILRTLMGKQYQITRQEHIVSGQRRCAYRITPIT